MSDPRIRRVQEVFNTFFGDSVGYVDETGKTGWNVVNGLIRALQFKLGIAPQVDSFGNGTYDQYELQIAPLTVSSDPQVILLHQMALWCKGYWAGDLDGIYGPVVQAAITQFRTDAGLAPTSAVTTKIVQALMNMDPYVIAPGSGGMLTIRTVQQWLNSSRQSKRSYRLIPCDGRQSPTVQRGLVFSIQYELGIADTSATGAVGPSTRTQIKALPPLSLGSFDAAKQWVRHLQAAMILNGYSVPLNGIFDASTKSAVELFQSLTLLPVTGVVDGATWREVLVSTGDTTRATIGCDTSVKLTTANLQSLKLAGYKFVGRYIKQTDAHQYAVSPGEVRAIRDSGMGLWLYFQASSDGAAYFTFNQGKTDALRVAAALVTLGRDPDDSADAINIFFAVDFDVVGNDYSVAVTRYFEGISTERGNWLSMRGSVPFNIGAYAPRGVAQKLLDDGLASAVCVSGMSTGFAENLGFPLPSSWALNQIFETSVAGTPIDKVVVRTIGDLVANSKLNWSSGPDEDLLHRTNGAIVRMVPGALPLSIAHAVAMTLANYQYLSVSGPASITKREGMRAYLLAGQGFPGDVLSYVEAAGEIDPATDFAYTGSANDDGLAHLGITWAGYCKHGVLDWSGAYKKSLLSDLAGWSLDVIQLWNTVAPWIDGNPTGSIAEAVSLYLGVDNVGSGWGEADLRGDVDGFLLYHRMTSSGLSISSAIHEILGRGLVENLNEFLTVRFGASRVSAVEAMKDPWTVIFMDFSWWDTVGRQAFINARFPSPQEQQELADAIVDSLFSRAGL